MTATRRAPGLPRGRIPLMAGAGTGLLIGLWTGLARAGVHDAVGPVAEHGMIMVLGFLGTLIALERAVALRARWSYTAPALSALSVGWLLVGLPVVGGGVLMTAAGLLVIAVYVATMRRHAEPHLILMATGAVAWVIAALAWTFGWSPVRVAPVLAAFLVLTIVGERLELSRLRQPTAASQRRLLAAAALFAAGTVIALVDRRSGLVVMGFGLFAQTAWLVRNDIARVTVRRPGLPRFAAACLLSGYVWLGASGALWIAVAMGWGGGLMHDAALHALFLGFVMSMVMGHAPIILPAVLGIPLPHRPWAWLPLVLLHASVTLRVVADLAGSVWLRGWAAHGNVTALLVFVASSIAAARLTAQPAPPQRSLAG